MTEISVDAARDICDVLDGVLLIARQERTPIRAVLLLEEARAELQEFLDKTDRAIAGWSSAG